MRTKLLFLLAAFAFSLLQFEIEASNAPSFLKVGSSYSIDDRYVDVHMFKIIALGDEGWIQVETEERTMWLNTNLVPVILEVSPEDEEKMAAAKKQEKTMSDMRAMATSCEAYAVDNNEYPAGRIEDMKRVVEPMYIKKLPLKDSWGYPYVYLVDAEKQNYWIISYGSDGRREENLYRSDGTPAEESYEPTTREESDIIFSDGTFIRYPKIGDDENDD
jgi:hypothetical protein